MAAVLFYLVAAAVGGAAAVRAARVRAGDTTPAGRAYVVLLAALAVTFTVMAPPSQAWVNRVVPDLFKLVGNCSTLIAAFSAQALMLYTSTPARQAMGKLRPRLVGLAVVLAVLVTMFFWPHPVALTGSFDPYLALDPTLAVYTLAYALYLGVAAADIAVGAWRFARHTARCLRVGLRLIALAGALGVGYAAAKIAIVVERVTTGSRRATGDVTGVCHAAFDSPGCAVAVGLPAVTALVLVVGVLLASGAARLDRLHRWAGQYRAYRRLEPLWRHLYVAFPEIARLPDQPWRAPGPGAVPWRLARRVVQIRDGLLLLAPYRRPDLTGEAPAGAAGRERDAVLEAARIAAALRARAAGVPVTADPPDPPPQRPADLDAEIAWLQRVSEAFARSPAGAAADRAQLAGEESHDPRC